jgi:hypothetical protein
MKAFWVLFLLISTTSLFAQHQKEKEHRSNRPHITFVIGHTFLPQNTVEGTSTFAIPSFGLDIEYFFSKKFGFGLHNDLELLNYKIKENNNSYINREYPLLVTADLLYKVNEEVIVFAGPGIEFEKERDLPVIRLGIEFLAHTGKHLTFSPIITYDHRIDAFNSLSVGIGIGFY